MSEGFTYGCQTTVYKNFEVIPETTKLYRDISQKWGPAPYLCETDHCKFTSPEDGNTKATEQSGHPVAKVLAALKTFKAVYPDTVDGSNTVRLPDNVLEHYLEAK